MAVLALGVQSVAGIALPEMAASAPWVGWLAVVVSALALVMNAISRSARQRRLWVPVAAGMLVSSMLVAVGT